LDLHKPEAPAIIQLLLQAGADLALKNRRGETPLEVLQGRHPTHPTTVALIEQSLDTEKASFLVKARRLVLAATKTIPPSFLQGRVACGLPFPDVALAAVMTNGQEDDDNDAAVRELRAALAFLVGMEGGGMPRDVLRVVLDL
jgi:hypothetical protein